MKTPNPSNLSLTRYFTFAFLSCLSFPVFIMAGPPFRTDDPEPVDVHHGEFYGASQITSTLEGIYGTAPHAEINYGIFPETQIHVIVPLSFNYPRIGNSTYGPGDIELGLKYRFVNESSSMPQIGVFPLIEIPMGNSQKKLGAGNTQLFFPVWVQKSWGSWSTYGGGGYLVTIRKSPANSLFIGWEGQRDFSKSLTIGAEVFGTSIPYESSENEAGFNIGTMVNLNDNHHLLLSAGRDIVGFNDLFLYAAYQYTIGLALK
jgi:hypothetical protein